MRKRRKKSETRATADFAKCKFASSRQRGCVMMIGQFLRWARTASAGARAQASGALARAYLYADLSPADRDATEDAMISLLDDPSPLVRRALAEALAASPDAPHAVVHALAFDHRDIAAMVLARSPLLIDAELVDLVAVCDGALQATIATRTPLRRAVVAAIAEVGSAEACLVAIENSCAEVAPSSIARIIDRFGHLAAIRQALLARPDLPLAARQSLVQHLSGALVEFVAERGWLARDRAEEISQEACEKAAVTIAALQPDQDSRSLIRHLCASGQLTAGLMLRAVLSGNMTMFEGAVAELSGLPLRRVRALLRYGGKAVLCAVFGKAGLPAESHSAFREALNAAREAHRAGEFIDRDRLDRRVVERALMGWEGRDTSDLEPLVILLRRFAAEAAREDARINCEQLVAGGGMGHDRAAA
jgi:uncharacterized protein (DUF2336 family)